ncbi:MAG: hypothetical protein ACO4BJ_05130 [Planctomycetota bacterium]|jgi:hypothetical protein
MRCRSNRRLRGAILASLLLLPWGGSGCTVSERYEGNRVSPGQVALVSQLETKAEVLRRIGPPDGIELLPNGSSFLYRHVMSASEGFELSAARARYERESSDVRGEVLWIEFDKQGRIRSHGFSQ